MSAHPTPAAPATPATTPNETGCLRTLGLLLFWIAVMILGFMVITPNPTGIRVMVFAITVLYLDYILFGGGTFWRQLVVRGTAFVLVLSMLSFLLPETYVQSIPSRDQVGQKLVKRGLIGGAWDGVKTLAFGESVSAPIAAEEARGEEELVLRSECYTPCSARVEFPYRIKYEGSILNVKHPGIPQVITYTKIEKGDKSPPPGLLKGETFFTSGDPNDPNFRVQVFERR